VWRHTALSFYDTENAKQGDLGSKVLPRNPTGVVWKAGETVEAKWVSSFALPPGGTALILRGAERPRQSRWWISIPDLPAVGGAVRGVLPEAPTPFRRRRRARMAEREPSRNPGPLLIQWDRASWLCLGPAADAVLEREHTAAIRSTVRREARRVEDGDRGVLWPVFDECLDCGLADGAEGDAERGLCAAAAL
jgi:hypothetical protein